MIWVGNSRGLFTVKSAYHLQKALLLREQGEHSGGTQGSRVWSRIWNLGVPGAVRTFLWRLCNNTLPTKANLFKKQITSDPFCPICGQYSETSVHVLWSCASAMVVWMECNKQIQKLSLMAHDGFHLFEQLMDRLEEDDLIVVTFLLRRLWLRRNATVFRGEFTPPLQLIQQGLTSLHEYNEANRLPPSSSDSSVPNATQSWKKPLPSIIKINWDASINSQNQRMGVGILVRNEEGAVMAAVCATVPSVTDPSVAEAVALWRAVSLGREMNLSKIFFEGDSLEIIQAVMREDPCWSRYGQVIDDIRNSLTQLPSWQITHIRRDANEGAHLLAKAAASQSLNYTWWNSYPVFISSLVNSEQGSF